MMWVTRKKPELGQIRERRKFAFRPVETTNGFTVWLEFYTVVERLDDVFMCDTVGTGYYRPMWTVIRTTPNWS